MFQAYIGPSVTTYLHLNPGYRIFTIDGHYSGSSYWLLDYRTVIMDSAATNKQNRTIFHEEYSARDAYQMQNLFPNDWNDLLERLQNDIDKSYDYKCDHQCRREFLCKLKSARSEDPHVCDAIPPSINENLINILLFIQIKNKRNITSCQDKNF